MSDRRSFIAGMLAAGLCPRTIWAEAGSPAFLSAGMKPDGSYVLCGLSEQGGLAFELPLPARGHAAAARPIMAEAVAFSRRPGMFAIVINCASGRQTARLRAPPGRHFNGHGAFSGDGDILFTTENDYEAARGVIGIWAAGRGYKRIGEFYSGGVGPHDIKLLPDGETLAVANGGIETHPDTGRAKLNIPFMRPNLAYFSLDGRLSERLELEQSLRKNSIRHLAVTVDGAVAFASQWQGDVSDHPPLLGLHTRGDQARLFDSNGPAAERMRGYAGSVAVSRNMTLAAVTSPRGGVCQVFEIRSGQLSREWLMGDVCGIAPYKGGFLLTSGTGSVLWDTGAVDGHSINFPFRWDNHLVPVSS